MIETAQLNLTGPSINRHRSKQDYGTPWPLIRAIEKRWGSLAIDLAATAENAKAPRFITPEQDSLTQPWNVVIGQNERAFLNPEFADIDPWAARCNKHRIRSIIFLVPASIGSEWFAEHCEANAKIIGLRPRICYEGCHQLFAKNHPRAGERKCDLSCVGCATYPKDCMLNLFGPQFDREPKFQTWRWDA
jgi:phage N-6-adenine-methyltransferase